MSAFDKKAADLRAPFPEEQIEWRIQQGGLKADGSAWVMCLAYVDARAVQNRLDEVVGADGWMTEFIPSLNGILCRLSILVDGMWIHKMDGSPETEIEAFKGGLSKALVRTASAWGIGRYLYKLEANFADIANERKPGYQFASVKDKKSGKSVTIYWKPPKLPVWALPEAKDPAPKHSTAAPVPPPEGAVIESPDKKVAKKALPVGSPLAKQPPAADSGPRQAPGPVTGSPPVKPNATPKVGDVWQPSLNQLKMVWSRLMKLEYDEPQAKEFMRSHTGKEHSKEWTRQDFDKVLGAIEFLEKKNRPPEDPDGPQAGNEDHRP